MTLKKNIENAMLKEGIHYDIRDFDFAEGDIVQLRHTHYLAGKVGRIIGIKVDRKKDRFCYTVQFSDKASVLVNAGSMVFLHRGDLDESEPFSSECDVTDDSEEQKPS